MLEQFGDYKVYEQIGIGGMASVHRAVSKLDGRSVALKRLLSHRAADPDAMRAFLDEARLARKLAHPNIATTYDCGNVGGTYFIAMELVPGHTLAQLIRRCSETIGIIPFPITVNILIQLCDALEYAHKLCDASGKRLGIIHRDVSPANVILSSNGVVKLIDFGIAKAAGQTAHSHAGVVKGKFSYMAPEYLKGTLDYRVDLWALGVVAHELLTNRRLFQGQNDFETIFKVRADDLEPPSRHNAEVPSELDAIVMTALQRDPDQRWQSAGAMRTALANAAAELQTIVTNPQLIEWVEWMFTQAPLDEGSELSQLIKLLEMPRSTISKVVIVDPSLFEPSEPAESAELREPVESAELREPVESAELRARPVSRAAPSRAEPRPTGARAAPSRAEPRPIGARATPMPAHEGPVLGKVVLSSPSAPAERKTSALRVVLLFCLLVAVGAYAAWHYGYLPAELTDLLGLPRR